jgi:cytochrome c oxidase subunit 2
MTIIRKKLLMACLLSGAVPGSCLYASEAGTRGEQLFKNNCMACHQQDGRGIPDVYPALDDSEVVRGSADDVALVALIGRGDMPSFRGSLSAEDLAAIVSYVRSAWSNDGGPITAARVAQLSDSLD